MNLEITLKKSLIKENSWFLPLQMVYTVPKNPDYNNSYKWLSIATAFNLENAKEARDKISTYVKRDNLTNIQNEAKKFDMIKKVYNLKQNLMESNMEFTVNGLLMEKLQ